MSKLRAVRLFLWLLVALTGAAALGVVSGVIPLRSSLPEPKASGVAAIGGPFQLTSHRGVKVTDETVRGRPFLVFFGFTYCPDICPTTLAELTTLYEELGADADKVQTLFVTVDPERDTQDMLAEYMQAFDPRFIALRGTAEETEAVAKTFKAFYQKVPLKGGSYTMDHNAIVYMMDREGRFAGSLDPHESRDTQLAKLRRLIATPGS